MAPGSLETTTTTTTAPVDLAALARWMDAAGLEAGPVTVLERLPGGTQNLMLRLRRGGREFVLRQSPPSPVLDGNRTMRREARLLAALAGTDVPHPRLVALCDDPALLGGVFYLMEVVRGFNATTGLPPLHAGDPAVRHAMSLALVDGIASLAAVDPVAVGLGDFGRLEGFLARQAGRWRSQLEGYRQYMGWPGPQALPEVEAVGAWLDAHLPAAFRPGLMHGDYHIGNVMFAPDGPALAAIVDWELATLGDPLLDLGRLLAQWPEGGAPPPGGYRIAPHDGLPDMPEMIAHYAARTGRDLAPLRWHAVLASYKLGILLEGSHARAFAGKAPRETGETLHQTAIECLQRAAAWIEGGPFA
ncbi:phosphotransferase family protein [Roseicella sp. DB1501]|uniref:phosphotransferase family protein n=1 Tax=Roseicella sp. DB1501 TaxID=2730925 RepID=UPI0014921AE0|nr:phosphotransferase family protein [Roseicella sp. DB1501]NOG71593.1 phosphotransferase family protein [Roseicella sp. DB1501]